MGVFNLKWLSVAAVVTLLSLIAARMRRRIAGVVLQENDAVVPKPATQPAAQSTYRPTNEVEHLLCAAAEDLASRPAFYRALLDADVFMLGTVKSLSKGQQTLSLSVYTKGTGDGTYLSAFTSEAALLWAAAEGDYHPEHYVGVRGWDLFKMMQNGPNDLALNLGHD